MAAAVLQLPWATGLQSDGRDLSLFLRERVERGRQRERREGFEFIFVLTNCPSLSRLAWRRELRGARGEGQQKSIFSGNFLSPFVRPSVNAVVILSA